MRRLFLFLLVLVFCASCNGGLKKSIMEPLAIDEIRKNIQSDTTFSDLYKNIQEVRAWLLQSDINQAEYGDISYKRILKYKKTLRDTNFQKEIDKKLKLEYEAKYPNYDKQVDSIMAFWRSYSNKYALDSFVKIEFSELWKEYYSYSGDVKQVNVGFDVTPLRGRIEQLIFRYCIKSKIQNDGKLDLFDSHRCLSSRPISKTTTLYWEADYSDEKYLKSKTTESVKRDYDFNIELVEIRIDGENISDKLSVVPDPVMKALKYCSAGNNYYADDIVKELIDKNYKSYWEYAAPLYDKECEKIDPGVFGLYEAFHKRDK